MVALAIAFSGLSVALTIIFATGVLWNMFIRLEELGHLFFAVARSTLSLELLDRGLPVPEWLSVGLEDGDSEEHRPAKVISLFKSVKVETDKPEG